VSKTNQFKAKSASKLKSLISEPLDKSNIKTHTNINTNTNTNANTNKRKQQAKANITTTTDTGTNMKAKTTPKERYDHCCQVIPFIYLTILFNFN